MSMLLSISGKDDSASPSASLLRFLPFFLRRKGERVTPLSLFTAPAVVLPWFPVVPVPVPVPLSIWGPFPTPTPLVAVAASVGDTSLPLSLLRARRKTVPTANLLILPLPSPCFFFLRRRLGSRFFI